MRAAIARICLVAITPLGALTGLALSGLDIYLCIQLWPNLLAIILVGPLVFGIGITLTQPIAWALGGLALLLDREGTETWLAVHDDGYDAY